LVAFFTLPRLFCNPGCFFCRAHRSCEKFFPKFFLSASPPMYSTYLFPELTLHFEGSVFSGNVFPPPLSLPPDCRRKCWIVFAPPSRQFFSSRSSSSGPFSKQCLMTFLPYVLHFGTSGQATPPQFLSLSTYWFFLKSATSPHSLRTQSLIGYPPVFPSFLTSL